MKRTAPLCPPRHSAAARKAEMREYFVSSLSLRLSGRGNLVGKVLCATVQQPDSSGLVHPNYKQLVSENLSGTQRDNRLRGNHALVFQHTFPLLNSNFQSPLST